MINKQVWEARLLANFHNVSVADAITTKPESMDGAVVTFTRLGAGSVKDYDGEVEWDEVTTTPVELTLNQKKYFAFAVSDIQMVGTNPSAIDDVTSEQSAVLAETVDEFVLSQAVADAKVGNKIGNKTTKKEIANVTEAYDYISDLGTLLNKAKAPRTDRFVVVNSDFLNLLQKDDRFTRNPEILANGIVANAKIAGLTVVVSEEVAEDTVVALHKSAIGYGKFIDKLEAMRLQSSFADGVRGLAVYDAQVLRDDVIAVLHYDIKLGESA